MDPNLAGGVMRSFTFVVTMALAGVASAEGTTVGVLPVDAHKLSASEVEALADAITVAAHELLPGRVLGPPEVRAILEESGVNTPKRCKSKRCWLKVGKAVELTAVLAVRAAPGKRGVALSLKWVDVSKKRVVARHQQPIRKDILTFAEDARTAMQQLRDKLAGKVPEPVGPAAVAEASATPSKDGEAAAPAAAAAEDPEPDPGPAGVATLAAAPVAREGSGSAPKPHARGTRVWLGLGLGRGSMGAVVQRVAPGGPGAAADLQPGDVIVAWDGWLIATAKDVLGFAMRTGPGGTARIKVSRGGTERMLSITPKKPRDAVEADAYETTQPAGGTSSMPARPADSAPPNWSPPARR